METVQDAFAACGPAHDDDGYVITPRRYKALRDALEDISAWTMRSSQARYTQGETDPRGYYANAFELAEEEIAKARIAAKLALAPFGE